ncbi:hypothetical protein ACFL60_07920 [Candidatus Omnitrophota bacterium]
MRSRLRSGMIPEAYLLQSEEGLKRKLMKKLTIIIVFILAVTSTAIAATFTGTPEEFRVTINKVEFYNSTTDEWMVAGTGDYTFDITSVIPGQLCGGYGTPVAFTKGTYTKMRVTVSRTMQITGEPTVNGVDTYYTRTGTVDNINNGMNAGGDGKAQCAQANTTGPSQRCTTIIPSTNMGTGMTLAADTDYFLFQTDLATPAELGPGTIKRASIKFNATGVITYDPDTVGGPGCYVGAPPTITVAFY